MKMAKSIPEYLGSNEEWSEEINLMRDILLNTELEEALKWGTPHYLLNKKIVVGIGAFKSYVGLWFHQGVFLKDKSKVLINAQKDVTKGLRQWRFKNAAEIVDQIELIKAYVEEAINNQKQGKEIKIGAKPIVIPEALQKELEASSELMGKFNGLGLTKKREFTEYIDTAKREETKQKRLDKIIPMILDGVGLNDKYR